MGQSFHNSKCNKCILFNLSKMVVLLAYTVYQYFQKKELKLFIILLKIRVMNKTFSLVISIAFYLLVWWLQLLLCLIVAFGSGDMENGFSTIISLGGIIALWTSYKLTLWFRKRVLKLK